MACVVLFNMLKAYFTFKEEDEAEGHEAEEAHEAILQQDFQQAGFVVRDAIVNALFN